MKKTILLLSLVVAPLLAANSSELRDMGQALAQKGLYAKAADYFQRAVEADPSDWQSYEDLGNAHMKLGENGLALDAYNQSLRLHPDNPTLQTLVESLKSAGTPATTTTMPPPPSATPASGVEDDQWETAEPVTVNGTNAQPQRRRRARPQAAVFNDGLAPIDHARIWTQASLGYVNARVGDLQQSAAGWNQDIAANGWTGSATSPNDAVGLGGQLGFLLTPQHGLAIGAEYIGLSNYDLGVNYQNGPATVNGNPYNSDFDQTTLSAYVLPITLDYYFFLPDSSGRFFLSGGVGWYFGTVHVDRNYSAVIAANDENLWDQFSGDLHGNAFGFQARVGREWQVTPRIGLVLYAQGHFAKIDHFTGTVDDPYGNSFSVGLASEHNLNNKVFVEDTSNIGGAADNRYASIDFTSIEVGFALNFYSF